MPLKLAPMWTGWAGRKHGWRWSNIEWGGY